VAATEAKESKTATLARKRLAGQLEDALFDIRAAQRTRAWVTGYSLAEALDERIQHIGKERGERYVNGRRTRIGHFETLRQQVADAIAGEKKLKVFPGDAKDTKLPSVVPDKGF
jgi:hypothetical protein